MPTVGWALSYSAPGFFPKDEQDEKNNLSPEEYAFIEDELHGKQVFDFDSFETPEQVSKSVRELRECMQNQLDKKLTATYFEALEKVPHLVHTETEPIMFLRTEHYDIENAATRLAMHWKERKLLFGEGRAFLPMTLNPDGAMGSCKTDMEQLELGYITFPPEDANGRPVIFLDRSNSTKSPTYQRDCWLRVLWYLVHVICTNPEYQKSGYVVIINLKDYNPAKCGDRLGAKKMFLYVRECWCPRFKGYHATYGSHQTPVKLVEPAIRRMQGRHIRLHLRNHYGYDSDNILAMKEFGLAACHLSPAIGGTFTHEQHMAWLQQRREIERRQKLASEQ